MGITHCTTGRCDVCDPPGEGDIDAEGFLLDNDEKQVGHCDVCGEEARVEDGCCGDIQPFEQQ